MGYNKFKTKSGTVLLDLTSDTVAPEELSEGITAHNKNGEKITGTFTIDNELSIQATLLSAQDAKLAELAEILSNKATATPSLQNKTVTPTTATQNVIADSGYDGLNKVTVNGDANLVPANIVSGKSIFGVNGTAEIGSGGGSSSTGVCPQLTITGTDGIDLMDCFYSQNGIYTGTYTGMIPTDSFVLNNVDINSPIIICVMDNIGMWNSMSGNNAVELLWDAASGILLAQCTAAGENSSIQLNEGWGGGWG